MIVAADMISVVIPVYNHERYVGAAIESALAQSRPPDEIVCIDDGSTDGSFAVVQAIAKAEPSLRCWTRPNRGAHATLNEGIAAARGSIIAILNSDDIYHPERLELCAEALADPSVSAVATASAFIDGDGQLQPNDWYERARAFHRQIDDLGLALVNGNFLLSTSNLVARRAVFADLGDFDALRYTHDLDFFLRLIAAGDELRILPRALLAYRIHGANTVSESQQAVRMERAVVAAAFARRMLASGAGDLAWLARLLGVAGRDRLVPMMALALLCGRAPGAALADRAFKDRLTALV